jgi:myosin-5
LLIISQVPKATDDTFAITMYNQLATKKHFAKPRLSNVAFIVKHYIDDVTYQVSGFLEKNKVCA